MCKYVCVSLIMFQVEEGDAGYVILDYCQSPEPHLEGTCNCTPEINASCYCAPELLSNSTRTCMFVMHLIHTYLHMYTSLRQENCVTHKKTKGRKENSKEM